MSYLKLMISKGAIYLPDGKTKSREVVCREGTLVDDVLIRVCRTAQCGISPVARIYFALCDFKTGNCLCPYSTLTATDAKKQYSLRVFVNTTENGFQFQKMSKAAYRLYYTQIREEFLKGQLYMLSVNTVVWMAGIEMARDATLRGKKFEDLLNPRDLIRYMPAQLRDRWKMDDEVKDQLRTVFQKFQKANSDLNISQDYFKGKYMEVYEKDEMCGTHIFKLKQSSQLASQKNQHQLLVVSLRGGICKMRRTEQEKEMLCQIEQVKNVNVDLTQLVAVVNLTADHETPLKLLFLERGELVEFVTVLHAYYRLKVDSNAMLMEGDLKPPPRCFRVGENDGEKADLCHAPIGPESVRKVLEQFNLEEGHFMVRESRNSDNAYTLSLCHNKTILNYRIIRLKDGRLSLQDRDQSTPEGAVEMMFPTLDALLNHHKHVKDGLATYLKQNCCPKITGPIPILPSPTAPGSDDSSDYSRSNTSIASTPGSEPPPESPLIQSLKGAGVLYIKYSELVLEKELGSGHFSNVYQAMWKTNDIKVAVKVPTMQSNTKESVTNDLKREIETMARLDNPHIVKLLGITDTQHFLSFIGQLPMVVMEFIEEGSLRGYLEDLKRNLTHQLMLEKTRTLARFCKQIAEGMEYLEQNKVVHRDLATRNVLVVSEDQIKISDFGLARQRFEDKDYYQGKSTKDLPIYWYAPECLEQLKFTHKSDVWSYGVTTWEIFTFGELPTNYLQRHITNWKSAKEVFHSLAQFYKGGISHRLPKTRCRDDVYDYITSCWAFEPAERPSFEDLTLKFALLTTSIT